MARDTGTSNDLDTTRAARSSCSSDKSSDQSNHVAVSRDTSTSHDLMHNRDNDESNGGPQAGNDDLKKTDQCAKVKTESNVEISKNDEGFTHELKHILSSPRSQTIIQTKPLDFSKTRVSELRASPVSALDLTSPKRTDNTETVTAIHQTKIKTSPSTGDYPSKPMPVESEESQTASSYIPILSTGADQNERSVQQNTGTTECSPNLRKEETSKIEGADTNIQLMPPQDVSSAIKSMESTSQKDQPTPRSNDATSHASEAEPQPDDKENPTTSNQRPTTVIEIIDSPEKFENTKIEKETDSDNDSDISLEWIGTYDEDGTKVEDPKPSKNNHDTITTHINRARFIDEVKYTQMLSGLCNIQRLIKGLDSKSKEHLDMFDSFLWQFSSLPTLKQTHLDQVRGAAESEKKNGGKTENDGIELSTVKSAKEPQMNKSENDQDDDCILEENAEDFMLVPDNPSQPETKAQNEYIVTESNSYNNQPSLPTQCDIMQLGTEDLNQYSPNGTQILRFSTYNIQKINRPRGIPIPPPPLPPGTPGFRPPPTQSNNWNWNDPPQAQNQYRGNSTQWAPRMEAASSNQQSGWGYQDGNDFVPAVTINGCVPSLFSLSFPPPRPPLHSPMITEIYDDLTSAASNTRQNNTPRFRLNNMTQMQRHPRPSARVFGMTQRPQRPPLGKPYMQKGQGSSDWHQDSRRKTSPAANAGSPVPNRQDDRGSRRGSFSRHTDRATQSPSRKPASRSDSRGSNPSASPVATSPDKSRHSQSPAEGHDVIDPHAKEGPVSSNDKEISNECSSPTVEYNDSFEGWDNYAAAEEIKEQLINARRNSKDEESLQTRTASPKKAKTDLCKTGSKESEGNIEDDSMKGDSTNEAPGKSIVKSKNKDKSLHARLKNQTKDGGAEEKPLTPKKKKKKIGLKKRKVNETENQLEPKPKKRKTSSTETGSGFIKANKEAVTRMEPDSTTDRSQETNSSPTPGSSVTVVTAEEVVTKIKKKKKKDVVKKKKEKGSKNTEKAAAQVEEDAEQSMDTNDDENPDSDGGCEEQRNVLLSESETAVSAPVKKAKVAKKVKKSGEKTKKSLAEDNDDIDHCENVTEKSVNQTSENKIIEKIMKKYDKEETKRKKKRLSQKVIDKSKDDVLIEPVAFSADSDWSDLTGDEMRSQDDSQMDSSALKPKRVKVVKGKKKKLKCKDMSKADAAKVTKKKKKLKSDLDQEKTTEVGEPSDNETDTIDDDSNKNDERSKEKTATSLAEVVDKHSEPENSGLILGNVGNGNKFDNNGQAKRNNDFQEIRHVAHGPRFKNNWDYTQNEFMVGFQRHNVIGRGNSTRGSRGRGARGRDMVGDNRLLGQNLGQGQGGVIRGVALKRRRGWNRKKQGRHVSNM